MLLVVCPNLAMDRILQVPLSKQQNPVASIGESIGQCFGRLIPKGGTDLPVMGFPEPDFINSVLTRVPTTQVVAAVKEKELH